jgi:hypothetical protein
MANVTVSRSNPESCYMFSTRNLNIIITLCGRARAVVLMHNRIEGAGASSDLPPFFFFPLLFILPQPPHINLLRPIIYW